MMKAESPIGVFDSGVGGISVLREMVALMPNENFIYFGDSKNAPYGTKTVKEVQDLSLLNAEMLLERGVKAIVIACNTATSVAGDILRKKYPNLPIVGVEPALKPAVLHKENSRVLVMATEVTLNRDKFKELLKKYSDMGEIYSLPCNGLMEWVEKGILDGEELKAFLENLLMPYKNKVDSIVLGCTHYPFLKDAIKNVMGGEVVLFDGGLGTAKEVLRRLRCMNLENCGKNKSKVEILNSNNCPEEKELCEKLLWRQK